MTACEMFQSKRLQRLGLSAASSKAYLTGWQSADEKETETWRVREEGAVIHTLIGSFSLSLGSLVRNGVR